MAVRHGRKRYGAGCRCDSCRESQRLYQRRYRERLANGETRPASVAPVLQVHPGNPGPVESAVAAELGGLAEAQSRPSLVQVALAMARILDSSRAVSAQPAAAKVLVTVLDTLRKGSPRRRGGLELVRTMAKASVTDGETCPG
jgi:hypothetical protein